MTASRILEPVSNCVHCGFCLPACPTYLATGDESDSPRGRIMLMRALARGDLLPTDAALGEHLDACLGCRGCEPVCPSGVRYGEGLEAARAMLAEVRPHPIVVRLALTVFRHRWLWRPLLAVARLLRATGVPARLAGRGRVGFAMGMLSASAPSVLKPPRDDTPGAAGADSGVTLRAAKGPVSDDATVRHVHLFTGCVMASLFGHVHDATERALAQSGLTARRTGGQVCCGALHAHAGDLAGARALARRNMQAFAADSEPIVVNSAGCGAMLKQYGHLLGSEEAGALGRRVSDVSEFLAARPAPVPAPCPVRAVYDAPCHLLHAQGIRREPLELLSRVPGLELLPLPDADQCCGSAGLYALAEPGMSRAVLEAKVRAIMAVDPAPALVLTGNPGCLMQIGAGLRAAGSSVRVAHPVELLAADPG